MIFSPPPAPQALQPVDYCECVLHALSISSSSIRSLKRVLGQSTNCDAPYSMQFTANSSHLIESSRAISRLKWLHEQTNVSGSTAREH